MENLVMFCYMIEPVLYKLIFNSKLWTFHFINIKKLVLFRRKKSKKKKW